MSARAGFMCQLERTRQHTINSLPTCIAASTVPLLSARTGGSGRMHSMPHWHVNIVFIFACRLTDERSSENRCVNSLTFKALRKIAASAFPTSKMVFSSSVVYLIPKLLSKGARAEGRAKQNENPATRAENENF